MFYDLLSCLCAALHALAVVGQTPTVEIVRTDPPSVRGGILVAALNRDVTLDCYVDNLLQIYAVRWKRQYHNVGSEVLQVQGLSVDVALDDNIHYGLERPTPYTWRLRVRAVQVRDEGTYICFVQTTLTNTEFANRTVTVVIPPHFDVTRTSLDTVVDEGERLELMCSAIGRPLPVVHWTRLGGALLPNGHEKFTGSLLVIATIRPADRGVYRCTATNSIATIARDVTITVRFKPVLQVQRPIVYQAIGYQVELQCFVEADPPPQQADAAWIARTTTYTTSTDRVVVRWVYGGFGRLMYELVITRVEEYDYGVYICRIRNSQGTDKQITLAKTMNPQRSIKLGRVVAASQRPIPSIAAIVTSSAAAIIFSGLTKLSF